jgi:alpha-L-fucosidase
MSTEAVSHPSAAEQVVPGNDAARQEWFRDLGFGLFIHWSLDSQLGAEISHSMVGADSDYLRRFVEELPATFDPRDFDPRRWAVLARLCGVRYVVFTTKHHNGFCMFRTDSTDFGIANTAFERDITGELVAALREQGLAVGFYFSPDDFHWLYRNGLPIQRGIPQVQPAANPGLMRLAQQQVTELLTGYGDIDLMFYDGEADELRELTWATSPHTLVTRGSIRTPEQYVPGAILDEPWEANMTMGTSWPYKPTNETYKSGGRLIRTLIETRAKGGNFLLNVGPDPLGRIPVEQEARLREIALWMFVNRAAIEAVRPWILTNEGDVWFTRNRHTGAVYAAVCGDQPWRYGSWNELTLRSVRATAQTRVRVLGQNDRELEYQPDVVPQTSWEQRDDGLHIRAMRAQRLYTDRTWPNPVVLELTGVEAALEPPRLTIVEAQWHPGAQAVVCRVDVGSLGDQRLAQLFCEYQDVTGLDRSESSSTWTQTGARPVTEPGVTTVDVAPVRRGHTNEIRPCIAHPLLTVRGASLRVHVPD